MALVLARRGLAVVLAELVGARGGVSQLARWPCSRSRVALDGNGLDKETGVNGQWGVFCTGGCGLDIWA